MYFNIFTVSFAYENLNLTILTVNKVNYHYYIIGELKLLFFVCVMVH
jgi:hypothetical protein